MDAFKTGYEEFRKIATQEGYTRKVVGDYSYRKPRRKKGKFQYIKLLGIDRKANIKLTRFEQ